MSNKLFNTPFELSLHVILLLDTVGKAISLDRIAAYDFIAIYSEDFAISDISLNGENGFAFSELSARRKLIRAAVKDLVLDRLVMAEDAELGILYSISDSGRKMSDTFQSEYAAKYKELMALVIRKYEEIDDVQLLDIINRQSTKSLRR